MICRDDIITIVVMKRDDKIYKGFLYKALLDYQFRFQSTLDAYKRLMKTATLDEASIYIYIKVAVKSWKKF